MSLADNDFESKEDKDLYEHGTHYIKMAKTTGWADLRHYIETTINLKVASLETCEEGKIKEIRGQTEAYRSILRKVDSAISTAIDIEKEIKGIPNEED